MGFAENEKVLWLSPRDPTIWGTYLILGWCQLLLNRVDQPIDLLIKPPAAKQRPWVTHFGLAARSQWRPRRSEASACQITQAQSRGRLAGEISRVSPLGQAAIVGAIREDGGGWCAPSRFPRWVTAWRVAATAPRGEAASDGHATLPHISIGTGIIGFGLARKQRWLLRTRPLSITETRRRARGN
jgi:hypothetical protein